MTQAMITVRVNKEDKKRFEDFCNATGMNVSVAINMFIKSVICEGRLPFEVKADVPVSQNHVEV